MTSKHEGPGESANSPRATKKTSACNSTRFVRVPEQDRRIGRGDDFAGDAWLDRHTGQIVYGAVGVDRNANRPSLAREIAALVTIGLMVGTMLWSAVFGMAADLASGPITPIGYSVAEVNQDGR